jgi:hypothetical protein
VHFEPAFFQDADGADVVFGDAGVKRAGLFQAEESGERFGGHATAPKGTVDPIADLSLPVRRPTANISGYLTVNEHGLFQAGIVRQEFRPMLVERRPVARIEGNHSHGDRISLVLEKQGEILRLDVTELNVHERISTKRVTCDK